MSFNIDAARALYAATQEKLQQEHRKQADGILEDIRREASAGEKSLTYYTEIPIAVQVMLEADGFTVISETYRNETSVTISGWAE